MKAIVNTTVILEDGLIYDGVVLFDEKEILAVGRGCDIPVPEDAQIIDAAGKYTAPGLIDIHAHGGNGVFFYEDPERCCRDFIRNGTTMVLPALYQTMDMTQYKAAIDLIRKAREDGGAARIIGGLYMEGPFMNPKYGSAINDVKWSGPIDMADVRELADYAGEDVKVWCVAPEREGAEDFARYAKSVNPSVVFSVAHSECKPEMAYRLKKYGLKNQTHHTNATAVVNPLFPTNVGIRDVGPDEACLYDDDMYAELICDSLAMHVKPHMLRMVVKIKGIDRIILITDHYPETCEHPSGPIMGGEMAEDLGYDDQGWICGSRMRMDQACRNMMKHTGYGLCHVIRFASLNPARMLGINDQVGSIAPGKKPHLILMDDQVHVERTFFSGEEWVG